MASQIGLEFPIDAADGWDGFHNAGIEHFAGSPYAALGREVPQNTVDAGDVKPARLVVRLIEVPTDSVPDIESYRQVMQRCKEAAIKESPKATIFFERAVEQLTKPKLKVLQIADYNTLGVAGPCENGFPYYALMKASGQSKKSQDLIGSFGIGKYAPYASITVAFFRSNALSELRLGEPVAKVTMR